MPNENSLFYLANIQSSQILINKRQIETAKQINQTQTEITMISGDKFRVNINYGDLMSHLFQVSHTDYPGQ